MKDALCLAFLLVSFAEADTATYDREADPHPFTVFLEEGGWCWFQDPRAIIHQDHLFIGAIRGNGDGPALIGIYNLEADTPLDPFVAHPDFDHDDHNSPVFFPRSDDSVLAVYARHNVDKTHHYRFSDPADPGKWSKEHVYHHPQLPGRDKVTYMNLLPMAKEGKLYNFYRGFDFNPSFITSTDEGLTWSEDTHFIRSEAKGRHRPYVRYTGNGTDTVHLTFTDAHPRNFANSIYYAAFRHGAFFRADGSLIRKLEDGPLRPSEAQLVFRGGGIHGTNPTMAAWTSSIAIDPDGQPHIAYSLHISPDDLRYRIASWNGARWIDREVAHAGRCLYPEESSYTGLIALDPVDPTTVVISTDVDPSTGTSRGTKHEIYRARVGQTDDIGTIVWQAVTANSPVRNIRPLILRDGARRILLWNRGSFSTYTDYQLDTVGVVENLGNN